MKDSTFLKRDVHRSYHFLLLTYLVPVSVSHASSGSAGGGGSVAALVPGSVRSWVSAKRTNGNVSLYDINLVPSPTGNVTVPVLSQPYLLVSRLLKVR